ncbi:hypothetical protein Q7P37_006988 [Cladosporium fusiforme]
MGAPKIPYQPYASNHGNPNGPGDDRPTAHQVLEDCNAIGNLSGKTILITGTSSGIGIATAASLYETGARLFLTARDTTKLKQVVDKIVSDSPSSQVPRPELVEMDLSSFMSIRKAAAHVRSKTSDLNILIGNAGVMFVPFGRTEDGFETHFGVNHLAHFFLFQELKSLLIEGAKAAEQPSRVVLVSSSGHRFSEILFDDINFERKEYNSVTAYGQSKTANIYMANALTRIHAREGITGLSLHPGVIMETDIRRHMSDDALADLNDHTDRRQLKSAEQGVATTVWAAVSPHFNNIANGGRYLADVGECVPMEQGTQHAVGATGYTDYAYDEGKAERLWKVSCEAVGIPFDDGDSERPHGVGSPVPVPLA